MFIISFHSEQIKSLLCSSTQWFSPILTKRYLVALCRSWSIMTQMITHAHFLNFLFYSACSKHSGHFQFFFFFPDKILFCVGAIAPAVPSGWNMFILDLPMFRFILSFQNSTSIQPSPLQESFSDYWIRSIIPFLFYNILI